MKSKQKLKSNKLLDIVLSEEKFYFPGETIKGSVIVRPKKSNMKVNQIHIRFVGFILISAVEKEIVPLFTKDRIISAKAILQEAAKPYPFAFEFRVPENHALPSAMELGGRKLASVHYKLTAILDRPMMPESLCPKLDYPVLVLEHIDITTALRSAVAFKQKEYLNGQFIMKVDVPRTGFTRGETIPVNLIVNTKAKFVKKDCVVIELMRKIKIRTNKNQRDEEHVLKSNKFDLNIIGPYNFSQSITSRILIPSTPPTINYKDKLLRIQYKIRARLTVNDVDHSKKNSHHRADTCTLELPIIIGTWPRANIPIDDDDDDDIIQTMDELFLSDLDDEDDDEGETEPVQEAAVRNIILEEKHDNSSSYNRKEVDTYTKRRSFISMRRSESNGSVTSWMTTSHQQQQVYQQYQSTSSTGTNIMFNYNNNNSPVSISSPSTPSTTATITTTTAVSTTFNNFTKSIPENNQLTPSASVHQHIINQPIRNVTPTFAQINSTATEQLLPIESASAYTLSTPDLQQQQQQNLPTARVIEPSLRASSLIENNITVTVRPHERNSSRAPSVIDGAQQQHRRNGSVESTNMYSISSEKVPDTSVPNHTLTFISSTPTNAFKAPATYTNNSLALLELDTEGDVEEDLTEEDDDDDDLLAILEKKKKREGREMRQRQRMFYAITN